MTIATATNRSGPYTGNGVTTVFPYEFKIQNEAHVTVVLASPVGVEEVLDLGVDYTVDGVGDEGGGSVVMPAPLAEDWTLTFLLNIPFTQETDLENQGAYYAETVEDALDLSAQRDLQLLELVNRSIKIPASSDDPGALTDNLSSGILRLAESADEIDDVSGIKDEVAVVAGIAGDVALLADVSDVLAGTASAVRMDEKIFLGDGVNTAWTLDRSPGVDENLLVWIGGAIQNADDYSADGTALTISPAVADGVEIRTLVMTLVTANDVEQLRDETLAARDQALAVAGALPPVVANRMLVDNPAGTARETKTFAEVRALLDELNTFNGDGTTDDTANFMALQSSITGKLVDLMGRTFAVSAIPSANLYVNGFWKVGGVTYDAFQSNAMLSSTSDTGGIGAAYGGGNRPVPTTPGRTTSHMYLLLASQNCRSEGPSRAVNIGSIYSWAKGNVSGNYSSRQSNAWVPQSVNIGSEECRVYGGFRGANIASIYSDCTNESNANLACRFSYATGRNSGNLFSTDAKAGRGYGAEFSNVTVSGGAVTGATLVSGGFSYIVGDAIVFFDRIGLGTGAVASVTAVNASGTITAWSVSAGGSGYSGTVDATVDNGTGDYSFNLGTISNSRVFGQASGNIATSDCRVGTGGTSVNIAGLTNANDGSSSAIIGSAGSGISSAGSLSLILGGNNARVSASEAIAFGRFVDNPEARSLAGGNGGSGPLSSNRMWSISNNNGEMKSRTAFTVVGSFADFGEYFENSNVGVIEYGTVVMFDPLTPDKIVPWDGSRPVVGVVSATIAFMGDGEDFGGQDQFLYGTHGEPLYDDAGEQLPNPDYEPRGDNDFKKSRPELFSPVGFKGKVYVNVPEFVRPGDVYAGMHVMKITSEYDAACGYAVARCFI